jgi:hypothetical protein
MASVHPAKALQIFDARSVQSSITVEKCVDVPIRIVAGTLTYRLLPGLSVEGLEGAS